MKVLILAGGSGTRLWPLSTKEYPKQFLQLDNSGETLLQKTVNRHLGFVKPEDIFFLTNQKYRDIIVEQVGEAFEDNLVLEPVARNTMPAIALAVKFLLDKKGASLDDTVIVSTSDHYISPVDKFESCVREAEKLAKEGWIVTFGVKPTEPSIGYGYIQKDGYRVKRFVEKPNLEKAEEYLASGEYYWNSGMFIFSIRTIIEELEKYVPEIFRFLEKKYEHVVDNFENMPSISIDYAIMEKSQKAAFVPLTASWSDIGSFDQLYQNLDKDENNNVFMGKVVNHGSKNSLVMGKNRLIAVIDVEDLCIVDSGDAILITKRSSSQDVKKIMISQTK